MKDRIRVAVAGNPNSGKSTVFNNLTGIRQHVGNYPGVTVEKKEGRRSYDGREIEFVDLPGTYSLTAYSEDELIARNYVIGERPDVVLDVVDSSNLERNLYLAVQFMELDVPLLLALNMSDEASRKGIEIDYEKLSEFLGVPVVPTIGHKAVGMDELLRGVVQLAESAKGRGVLADRIRYGAELEEEIDRLAGIIAGDRSLGRQRSPRWLAIKLLEGDGAVEKEVTERASEPETILRQAKASRERIKKIFGDEPEIVIADRRYAFISDICRKSVRRTKKIRRELSDRIDSIVANRVLGIPLFLFVMWLVFRFTFTVGEPPMELIDSFFGWLGGVVEDVLPEGALRSLLADGVIGGVGSVLVFLPNIILLFLAIAFLEDSGYMARAAFVMDRVMQKIGLHGKSFIPMLLGFGCNIPAVMAARTLENRRDRLLTIMVIPLMSCSARMPVYVLLCAAFFPAGARGNVVFSLYIAGIGMAVIAAKIFRHVFFKGEAAPFIMELPPYRMPTFRGILIHTWERTAFYIKKAGTIILALSVLIWFLSSYPTRPALKADYAAKIDSAQTEEEKVELEAEFSRLVLKRSYAGEIGRAVAYFLKPVGLGDWKIGTALFAGFGAKEVVVSTMGTLYAVGDADEGSESLIQALRNDPFFNPLVAYTFMVFVLLYVPCLAAVAVIWREAGSWRWAALAMAYTTILAWIVSFVVYNGGKLLGVGG